MRWEKALILTGLFGICGGSGAADYAEWSLSIPEASRGFGQDADGDGVPNGLEYLSGTDPLAAEGGGGVVLRFGLAGERGQRQPRLDLSVPAGQPADVAARLEVSADLQNWGPVADRFGNGCWQRRQGALLTAPAGGAVAVRWTGESLSTGEKGLFYRFAAELVPDEDGDADGLNDSWERHHGLDPGVDDAGRDPDGDGLTNLQERQAGTHPLESDTDGDGWGDGYEVAAGRSAVGMDDPVAAGRPQPRTGLLVLTP